MATSERKTPTIGCGIEALGGQGLHEPPCVMERRLIEGIGDKPGKLGLAG